MEKSTSEEMRACASLMDLEIRRLPSEQKYVMRELRMSVTCNSRAKGSYHLSLALRGVPPTRGNILLEEANSKPAQIIKEVHQFCSDIGFCHLINGMYRKITIFGTNCRFLFTVQFLSILNNLLYYIILFYN